MKKLLFFVLLLNGLLLNAQQYNNEWIDYSKTYYKFKVGITGLYRISQAELSSVNLQNTPVEQFQLWRNGNQIPVYTSVASGVMGGSDYLEFWGERNDGKPDKDLYRVADFQLIDKYSFQTDTAAFFLTVNPVIAQNARLVNMANNVAGAGAPDPYFMYTEGNYFRNYIAQGYYVDAGQLVYSSSYDQGENWAASPIDSAQKISASHPVYLYAAGPAASIKVNLTGNAINTRTVKVSVNADTVIRQSLDYLNYTRMQAPVPLTDLTGGTASISIYNEASRKYDRLVISQYELTYPRVFNFGNSKNFEFELPANIAGNYLEITNFSYGAAAPVLYDLTNGKRYVADISTPGIVKVKLAPSTVLRKLVLVNEEAANIKLAVNFETRNFPDFTKPSTQGDYLIISNKLLYNGAGGVNPIEEYKNYRASAAGGGYNAKIYDIDDLVDVFAYGIKKHPLSIRNFLRWARANYPVQPKSAFLIGHSVVYNYYRGYESQADVESLNLVPTFGNPASDVLLATDPGAYIPSTPIGRLSVISPQEVSVYLHKVTQYEAAQKITSPLIADKGWMKNVIHVVGGNDPILTAQLRGYMNKYKGIISDTLFGGKVSSFFKSTADNVQEADIKEIKDILEEGSSLLSYFGHSSSTTLDFNLDNPNAYNNQGKYPVFIVMGCNAGNFYTYNPARFLVNETLSEKFVLANERGSIAFIASSHFGIPLYLDRYNTNTYTSIANKMYGKTLGEVMIESIRQVYNSTSFNDYFSRMHTEQTTLHGDPALVLNVAPKPDYAIEDQLVKVSPEFISVAETSFKLNAKMLNIGKAVNGKISVEVKRKYPDGSVETVLKDTIPAIRYEDSIELILPIDPNRDEGLNKITITVDADNKIDELYETNNSITKDIFIYEDEIRPVYPLNYSIVNQQGIAMYASTADPFSNEKPYRFEIDTTALYYSSSKVTLNTSSKGGLLEFKPTITFNDSTVYYWRISPLDQSGTPLIWNEFSFIYLQNGELGFNQSHFYQHTKSATERIHIDSNSRGWVYEPVKNNIFIRNGIYPNVGVEGADYEAIINGQMILGGGCNYNELIFNVLDSKTFKPWKNDYSGATGLYNSVKATCGSGRDYNFQYLVTAPASRKQAMDFIDLIPQGDYVIVRSNTHPAYAANVYAAAWKQDESLYGAGNSLYHKLLNQGFAGIDMYDTTRAFAFVFKKDEQGKFEPVYQFGENSYSKVIFGVNCPTPDTLGYIKSPVFGPAESWKQLKWRGVSVENVPGDAPTVDVIGVTAAGAETTLINNLTTNNQDFDISSINAAQYPFVRLQMRNMDSVNLTPYQLKYWRITYDPVPEGAVTPNILFEGKDTVEAGEALDFKLAFKNISPAAFDSLRVKMTITDESNTTTPILLGKYKPLVSGDTITIAHSFDTKNLSGHNNLYVEVNPDNDQPEQFHFNNFIYKNIFVKSDGTNPLLDVTFDGVHILNKDIVSSKPHVTIKLKDESVWSVLTDTSLVNVKLKYPDGKLVPYYFNKADTLRFTPAGPAPNTDNTATIDFLPYLSNDGEYELIVTGKDNQANEAGRVAYRVAFNVYNKPMISNMLNYPNPFTSSTAFVFTITGSEVPQNIKIQILTITGKVVREVTKDELGPLRIGRNITEFKWDGSDEFGQKLGNGVYLYRVVTNLNGKSLDKFKADGDKTDKYFNKGYGKMYLMR